MEDDPGGFPLRLGATTAVIASLWISRVLDITGLNVVDLEKEGLPLAVTVSGPKADFLPVVIDFVGCRTSDDVIGASFKSSNFRWEVLDRVAGFEASVPVLSRITNTCLRPSFGLCLLGLEISQIISLSDGERDRDDSSGSSESSVESDEPVESDSVTGLAAGLQRPSLAFLAYIQTYIGNIGALTSIVDALLQDSQHKLSSESVHSQKPK